MTTPRSNISINIGARRNTVGAATSSQSQRSQFAASAAAAAAATQMDERMMVDEEDIEEISNQIRSDYRNIREQIQENRLEYTNPNSNAIEVTLENIQEVFKRVKKPREAVSDSKVLYELSVLHKERVKNVQCVFRAFNNAEYMDKVKKFMYKQTAQRIKTRVESDEEQEAAADNNDDDGVADQNNRARRSGGSGGANKLANRYVLTKPILSKFGQYAMSYFRLPPRPTFLLGSLDKDLIVTHRRARQRRAPTVDDETKRTKIKELTAESDDENTNSTVHEIERIFKVLKRIYKRLDGLISLHVVL